jgi:thiosulfate dehydrogenase (quinone) large subunit
MLNRASRYLLAAIQAIIGWEWIVSGSNKVLTGNFPQTLINTLNTGIQDNPNAWYVSFLQSVVEPHSIFFGYVIEWTEMTIGVVFLASALILLGQPRMRGDAQHRLAIGFFSLGACVAVLGAFLCVNFHFWMGHGLIPGVGAAPTNEGIDLDALVPPFSLVILSANLVLIKALRGQTWYSRLYRRAALNLRHFIGKEDATSSSNHTTLSPL